MRYHAKSEDVSDKRDKRENFNSKKRSLTRRDAEEVVEEVDEEEMLFLTNHPSQYKDPTFMT